MRIAGEAARQADPDARAGGTGARRRPARPRRRRRRTGTRDRAATPALPPRADTRRSGSRGAAAAASQANQSLMRVDHPAPPAALGHAAQGDAAAAVVSGPAPVNTRSCPTSASRPSGAIRRGFTSTAVLMSSDSAARQGDVEIVLDADVDRRGLAPSTPASRRARCRL